MGRLAKGTDNVIYWVDDDGGVNNIVQGASAQQAYTEQKQGEKDEVYKQTLTDLYTSIPDTKTSLIGMEVPQSGADIRMDAIKYQDADDKAKRYAEMYTATPMEERPALEQAYKDAKEQGTLSALWGGGARTVGKMGAGIADLFDRGMGDTESMDTRAGEQARGDREYMPTSMFSPFASAVGEATPYMVPYSLPGKVVSKIPGIGSTLGKVPTRVSAPIAGAAENTLYYDPEGPSVGKAVVGGFGGLLGQVVGEKVARGTVGGRIPDDPHLQSLLDNAQNAAPGIQIQPGVRTGDPRAVRAYNDLRTADATRDQVDALERSSFEAQNRAISGEMGEVTDRIDPTYLDRQQSRINKELREVGKVTQPAFDAVSGGQVRDEYHKYLATTDAPLPDVIKRKLDLLDYRTSGAAGPTAITFNLSAVKELDDFIVKSKNSTTIGDRAAVRLAEKLRDIFIDTARRGIDDPILRTQFEGLLRQDKLVDSAFRAAKQPRKNTPGTAEGGYLDPVNIQDSLVAPNLTIDALANLKRHTDDITREGNKQGLGVADIAKLGLHVAMPTSWLGMAADVIGGTTKRLTPGGQKAVTHLKATGRTNLADLVTPDRLGKGSRDVISNLMEGIGRGTGIASDQGIAEALTGLLTPTREEDRPTYSEGLLSAILSGKKIKTK